MDVAEIVRVREIALRQARAAGAKEHDAADAVQDAVVALLRLRLRLRCQLVSNVRAWLTAVVRRRHVDAVRRRSREQVSMAGAHAWTISGQDGPCWALRT